MNLYEDINNNLKESEITTEDEIKQIVLDAFDGTDFMVGDVEITDDGIDFDVTAYGPDGEMTRQAHLAIPSYKEQVMWACEDWMSEHNSPDSFYD